MPGFSDGNMGIPPLPAQYLPRAVVLALTPAIVATIVAAEQIFACAGANVGDVVSVSPPGVTAGLGLCSARVTTAGNIGITWANPTAGGLTPPAGNYLVTLTKCS